MTQRNYKCEEPFILDNGDVWKVLDYDFDRRGGEWYLEAELCQTKTSDCRTLAITMPDALSQQVAIDRARDAAWQFLNENRQRVGRSRYLWRNYVTVEVL
jgi:hypothetical protein